jgi:branched-chain amino acid transport system substrate-binding protein
MKKPLLSAALAATIVLGASGARAADQVKLGFIASLSGPLALVGTEMQRGMDLALAQLGGKLGGLPVKLSIGDDKAVPSEGVSAASKAIDEDKIDIVTGITPSNVLVATAPAYIDADVTVVVALAGANEFAGKKCDAHVFVTSFDNDDWDMVMGKWETEHGHKKIYFIGQDYQAGWEHIAAAQRTFKGEQIGPVFTPLAAVDFAAELAQIRAANPDGVHAFMVGNGGIAFVKQYAQAGLQGKIPLFGTDAMSTPLQWPAMGDATVGMTVSTSWSYEFDNAANKTFVAAYRAKNGGRPPAIFAALQYDAIMMIDAAVRQVNGKIEDKAAFRAALKKADFPSIRGHFKFNNNQYPINDLYVEQVVKEPDGKLGFKILGKAAENWQDPYHQDCPRK